MAATLAFLHGNGLCKETWRPIMRRLQQSPLIDRLQRRSGPVDMHALCLPLHGEKHDPRAHEDAVMTHHDGDATRPRVQHPMNDWARIITDAMQPEIQALREKCGEQSPSRRPLIGVGHSLGASILWATEVRSPGTFDGLVLFEPILGESTPAYEKLVDFLMDLTLPRAQKWSSKDTAREYFEVYPNFAPWNRESLHEWVNGAIVTDTRDGMSAILANHPLTEAAIFTGKRLVLSEDELAWPKCRVYLHSATRTRLFDVPTFRSIVDRHPDVYTMHDPMQGLGHLMVYEDPEASSAAILRDLDALLVDHVDDVVA